MDTRVVMPPNSQFLDHGGRRASTPAREHLPPSLGTRTSPSPCEILADTISVICEVSFCRNSSVPTSARDR